MKISDIDQLGAGLRAYYQKQSLSKDSVVCILARAAAETPAKKPERRFRWPVVGLALAASLMAMVVVGQFFYFQQHHQRSLTGLVLEEIAMNHDKKLDIEYAETRSEVLQTAMQRLDFSLQLPADIRSDFQLLGGRYCSIQGGLAAQLKVRSNETGRVSTLYVTPMTETLSHIAGQQTVQDAVDIRLWQWQGRFFGLATDVAPENK